MVEDKFPIGYTLKQASTVEDETFSGDELCFDEVRMTFNETEIAIILRPLVDTDEVEITQMSSHSINIENISPCFSPFIGKKLQTVWICENAQGYQDQIIFAFDFLHPSISFVSEGSVLKVFYHQQIKKDTKI